MADAPVRRLQDELLRSVVNAAPDGIIVVDDRGIIVFVNPMAGELFDYPAEKLLGEAIEVLLPDSRRGGHVAHRERYTADPHRRAMGSGLDLHGRRQNGEEFPVEIGLSPVQSGGSTFVIAVIRDVTERRAADQALMEAHEELALVDDRERIARDLHDTVIQRLFAVGLALQGALGGAGAERTRDRIDSAIDEIDGCIRDIRTSIFSLHARRVSTSGLRDEVLATAREAGRALGFEPHVMFDGAVDAMATPAVRDQLLPALREMLSNVVKHAAATRVSVSVAVDGEQLVLEVLDNGVGITPATHGGRGLGNIGERANALGGSCEVRAETGGGTRVEWRVPMNSSP